MPKIFPAHLPKALTSYDLLKAAAVLLMILDHLGHHFFPDEMWFRVAGRLCVPIWFFLIGYANTSVIPKRWFIAAAIVALSAVIAGQYLLPINILVTLILARYARGWIVVNGLRNGESLRGMFFILFLMSLPTALIFEYGTYGFLFVLLGVIVKNKEEVYDIVDQRYLKLFAFASFAMFYILQGVALPHASGPQALFMMGGFMGVGLVLWNFCSVTFDRAPKFMAGSFIWMFKLLGRRTLEIYVLHILIFRAICMYLYPEKYTFLDWEIIPQSLSAFVL